MEALEPNMYVRTKDGIIGKYNVIKELTNVPTLNGYYEAKEIEREYIDNKLYRNYVVVKASHNIIDLIQVGDYLNGFKVSKIERYDTKTIIKIGNSTFNVLEGEEIYTPSYDNNNDYEKLEKLKSIVTKEQFENISYKVGE